MSNLNEIETIPRARLSDFRRLEEAARAGQWDRKKARSLQDWTIARMREADDASFLSDELAAAASRFDFSQMEGADWVNLKRWSKKNYRALREAHPATAFGQLMRAGVQTLGIGWYVRYPSIFPDFTVQQSSDKRAEFYAPLHRGDLPKRTGAGERFTEQRVVGEDREILNYKYMGGESFQRELWEDDQTGQIPGRAQAIGEAMRVLQDVYSTNRQLGLTTTAFGVDVPASVFSTTNAVGTLITTPYSVNLYTTGFGNRPAAFGQLTYQNILLGWEALENALDPLGKPIGVVPNYIMVSTFDRMNVEQFFTSDKAPQTTPAVTTATQGFARGAFADNVLKGKGITIVVNRYMPRGAWILGVREKSLIYQLRDPLEVVQEVPNSGASFDTDSMRFRSRSRFEFEHLDSRFTWEGNDGSASLTQAPS